MAIKQADVRPPSSTDSIERAAEAVRHFSLSLWVDLVRRDQSERWQGGAGVPVERYFELLPELRNDSEDALVLVCGEARARSEFGDRVSLNDYEQRFPDLADDLAIQFELDGTFGNLSGDVGDDVEYAAREVRLPGYEILRPIGRGASGVVYLALQISVARLVAAKVMHAWSVDEKQLSRHRQEASILSRMKHPNIVQIHDTIEIDGMLATIIEYVDGPTLEEFTGGQPQPPRDAAQLVRTLARAVHAVHEAGILHRDLKPSNVLLSSEGEPKITDFGLAKLLSNASLRTTQHCLVGTPSYMSPEQAASDDGGPGREGDVYSLGAILYELLTGRPPFLGVTILDTLSMIRERDPIPPHISQPRTPRDLETICLKCLAKSPQERYRTAAGLADDIERFLSGTPIQARRPAWHERTLAWCRRYPTVAALSACLLLTGLLGFFGVVWQWRRAEIARRNESVARQAADDRTRQVNEGIARLKLANGFLERGHACLNEYRWNDADAAFTRAIELRPDHVQAWEGRGEFLYVRLGLWELAAADLAHAFELQRPTLPHRWFWNSLLRMYMDDAEGYQRVCQELRERVRQHGLPKFALDYVRAHALAAEGVDDPRQLVAIADAHAATAPNSSVFRFAQAIAHCRADEHERAIEHCQASLAGVRGGFCAELNYPVLAIAYAALGRTDDARRELDQAENLMREWTQQRCAIGSEPWVMSLGASAHWPISCWEWLEYEVYLREARAALNLPESIPDPWSHVLRARAFAGLRRFEKAEQDYATALESLSDDVGVRLEAHRIRGYYFSRLKQFDRATAEFHSASALRPQDSKLLAFCALTLLASGDEQRYRDACAELMNRFGDTGDRTVAGDIALACTLHPNALTDMSRLLPIGRIAASRYFGATEVLGAVHYRAGQFDEAIKCFEETARFASLQTSGRICLAMAHHRLGHSAQARENLDAAQKWIDAANHPDPDDLTGSQPKWDSWHEKVSVPILLGEARQMIEPASAASPPR